MIKYQPINPNFILVKICILIAFFLTNCNVENGDLNPRFLAAPADNIIDENSSIKVYSDDHNLVLSFHPEDYTRNFNLINASGSALSIEKIDFTCQHDPLFSNILWKINPKNLVLTHPVNLTIYYTHEEFSSWDNDSDLKVYILNREYVNEPYGDGEIRMFRFTDLSILENSIQYPEALKVTAEINQIGDIVLGMELEAN